MIFKQKRPSIWAFPIYGIKIENRKFISNLFSFNKIISYFRLLPEKLGLASIGSEKKKAVQFLIGQLPILVILFLLLNTRNRYDFVGIFFVVDSIKIETE